MDITLRGMNSSYMSKETVIVREQKRVGVSFCGRLGTHLRRRYLHLRLSSINLTEAQTFF